MTWPSIFYPHQVTIRAFAGSTGMGEHFAEARTVSAEVKDEQKLVRDREGREVVSSTQVTVALSESAPPGSLVTVWGGVAGAERQATVIAVARHDNRGTALDSFQVLSLE